MDTNELFDRAVEIAKNKDYAIFSISLLQRRLNLGFIQASMIVEEMERKGMIGPYKDGQREVLI
jgi:S-DNA-T family DNA segregation ATPase FtsK/SpoIIIE